MTQPVLGVEQPTSRHLVQPIAWRRPDQGLKPQLQGPLRARRRAPRQREWYPCRGLSTAATKMWTSKFWFNRPSFEKKSCPTRPSVTRSHKLHGRHEKSPTDFQVEQCNMIRGGGIFKERGMQRRLANAGSYLGFEQPTSRHLVQPIAWRRPDLGLNPQRQVPKRA